MDELAAGIGTLVTSVVMPVATLVFGLVLAVRQLRAGQDTSELTYLRGEVGTMRRENRLLLDFVLDMRAAMVEAGLKPPDYPEELTKR